MFSRPRHPSLLGRFIAVLSIALVLLLNVLAASPALHAWAHGDEPTTEHSACDHAPVGSAEHGCAVTLFAQGAEALLVFCLLMLVRPLARGITLRAPDWLVVARPYYWLVPSHAPPVA